MYFRGRISIFNGEELKKNVRIVKKNQGKKPVCVPGHTAKVKLLGTQLYVRMSR